MTKITYIWHDCFVIVTDRFQLVCDYWLDPTLSDSHDSKSDAEAIPEFILKADKQLPLYVLVSHHHKDHFNKEIFRWEKLFKSVKYVLSKDVARHVAYLLKPTSTYTGTRPNPENVVVLKTGESYSDELLCVEAFGSTDIGNSYYIASNHSTGGTKATSFFHAGDLNAWLWKDESTQAEIDAALSAFDKILSEIAAKHPAIDYVMFPVDSRIGTDYFTGAAMFVERIDVGHFFPMHFGLGDTPEQQRQYQRDACRIDSYANKQRGEYICLTSPYSTFAKF